MTDPVIDKFVHDQLSVWPMAAANFRSLKNAETRTLTVGGLEVKLQHNPARIRSSAAKVDKSSILARKCFLCSDNRPAEQRSLKFEGRKGRKYDILVNPYPIFPEHLVIARDTHSPQSIWHRMTDLTDLTRHHPSFTFFYNGPKCGASAPDHFHFQAAPRGIMPLESDVDIKLDKLASDGVEPEGFSYLASVQDAKLYHYDKFTHGVFVLTASTSKSLAKLFYRLLDCLPQRADETEPMFNLLAWYNVKPSQKLSGISHGRFGEYRAILLARDKHRSHHYFSEGADHLTMSPGCADMAGLFIVPEASDFEKLDENLLTAMLSEVSVNEETERNIIWKVTRSQQEVQVGIMSGKEIEFEIISDGAGKQKVSYDNGHISYNGVLFDELIFDAQTVSSMFAEPTFILYGVTIGIGFHWERKFDQKFAGSLKFIVDDDNVVAVNVIGIEDYLLSVISSEMKSSASLEFLKAHAVISRSWLLTQIQSRRSADTKNYSSVKEDYMDNGVWHFVRWYDREDHKLFDVCADDHCQRYEGLTMAVGDNVRKAIDQTWGEVLTYNGKICDARFSKCCGGMMERFSTCWADADFPYLEAVTDAPDGKLSVKDLSNEENVTEWILGGASENPEIFCNTSDKAVLSQVLNDYDLETEDFFRWQAHYTRRELSDLISKRSGKDIGLLKDIKPLERGASGRIKLLSITGTKLSMVIGKELVIRKFLSESHLRSSAFIVQVEKSSVSEEEDVVILKGAGWGHGVGLCQIGAAVMSCKGYSYREILEHYYPGSVCDVYKQNTGR